MTEEKWLTGADAFEMLKFVQERTSDRKMRLYACACCRESWNQFVPERVIGAVIVAEAFADAQCPASLLQRIHAALNRHADNASELNGSGYLAHVLRAAAGAAAPIAGQAAHRARISSAHAANDSSPQDFGLRLPGAVEYADELVAQADLLRDIFGNPFRSSELKPEWLTADVLALAGGMYESRSFGSMPILADALQDVGCDDEDMLSHCREAREHVRGCWVVDLLLGKA